MPAFAPGTLLAATDLPTIQNDATRLFQELGRTLEELGDTDFATFYERMVTLTASFGNRYGNANALIDGTLRALPRIGMFYGFRIADPAQRARLFHEFIDAFRAILAEMAERTEALFVDIGGSFPAAAGRQATGA
jgi:hypothetical protein